MINIISRSVVSSLISGPQKVATNLIKGLDILGYPYCINKALDSTSQLWVHDDKTALKKVAKLKIKAIVGPNIYIMPKNIPEDIDLSNVTYIHPSKWAVDIWKHFGYDKYPIDFWPAGINTDEFSERQKPDDGTVLIYFKQRYPEELDYIKNILEKNNIKYDIISYRFYKQKNYLEKLKNTKYLVWIGRQESQGIALQEALAMNVPMLVWDVTNMGHWVPTEKESKIFTEEELSYPATSAPFFNKQCGKITKNKSDLETLVKEMENNWKNFEPRKYIIENLNLVKQARDFIKLYETYYGISYMSGLNEKLLNNKKWRNSKCYMKIFFYTKDLAKKILKKY
ncbi:MAG: hypothetical protein WC827_02230 [Candidatus Paceibacterota bacterium]|jgi:hypothetical protein